MITTAEAIGKDDRAFRAAWDRILANSTDTATPGHARRTEPATRNYSVATITPAMVREEARRWVTQWPMPERVAKSAAATNEWSESMASLLNSRAGWLVRKYWHAAKDEVFTTARSWPVVSDLHEAALAVSRREGMA